MSSGVDWRQLSGAYSRLDKIMSLASNSSLFDLQRYNWVCHAVKQILVGREQAPRSRDADGGKSKNP